jgi:hypothetical protein
MRCFSVSRSTNNAEVTLCEDERRPRGGSGFEFSACPAAHGAVAIEYAAPDRYSTAARTRPRSARQRATAFGRKFLLQQRLRDRGVDEIPTVLGSQPSLTSRPTKLHPEDEQNLEYERPRQAQGERSVRRVDPSAWLSVSENFRRLSQTANFCSFLIDNKPDPQALLSSVRKKLPCIC